LVIWLLWVDDLIVCENASIVKKARQAMNKLFKCNDIGKAYKYVGCKVTRDEKIKYKTNTTSASIELPRQILSDTNSTTTNPIGTGIHTILRQQ
jgi:hypothetical protein